MSLIIKEREGNTAAIFCVKKEHFSRA